MNKRYETQKQLPTKTEILLLADTYNSYLKATKISTKARLVTGITL